MSRTFRVIGASESIGLTRSARLSATGHHVIGLVRMAPCECPGMFVPVELDDDATRAALRVGRRGEQRRPRAPCPALA